MSVSLRRKLYHLSKNCNSIPTLKQLLVHILHSGGGGTTCTAAAAAALLSFAATSPNGDIRFASLLFSQMASPTSFACNSMIQGLLNARLPDRALLLFLRMDRDGPPPDNFTYPFAVKACSLLSAAGPGRSLHARIFTAGLALDLYIRSALVRMYSEFDDVISARHLFDESTERDTVMWNSMIGGYAKCGCLGAARKMFDDAEERSVGTYNALLGGYVKAGCLDEACRLFDEMPERDVVSWNTMVGAKARSGDVAAALELFDRAPWKNVATWSAAVSGFSHSSRFMDALDVFKDMLVAGVRPNQAIFVSVLSSCAHLGALEQGVWIHGYIPREGFEVNDLLGSSLIDMYSKCGMLQGAVLVFDGLEKGDVCSWTSMIYGLAIHGCSWEAIHRFRDMEKAGVRPSDITFVAVLSACSHAGLVSEGREIFDSMQRVYGMSHKIEHYTCMVDLLSRANLSEEAREVIASMPMEPDVFVWGAFLGGLRIHGSNDFMHEQVVSELETASLQTRESGAYVLVSNIYASADQWEDALKVRRTMAGLGVRKNKGSSLIEVNGEVHEFLASGKIMMESKQLYDMLDFLHKRSL